MDYPNGQERTHSGTTGTRTADLSYTSQIASLQYPEEGELSEEVLIRRQFYNDIFKPCCDILATLAFSPLRLPMIVAIYTTILFMDQQNPLFVQPRTINSITWDGQKKIFNMFKFTTMKNGEVTKLGKRLRKYSLDELPQLFNVLKGEMSFVGPRARLLYEIVTEEFPENFKPGLTSPWQMQRTVKTNGTSPKDDQDRLDLEYANSLQNGWRQFATDLTVLFQTGIYVMRGKNA